MTKEAYAIYMTVKKSTVKKSDQIAIYRPVVGTFGEISKSALILVKIPLFNWQITGHNQNFNFCPAVNQSTFSNIN